MEKNKRKDLFSLSAAQGDASPGTPPRLGELWVTDPTPDSLHLSWTVPEGHFDSFVVQFKDRDGPRVVPVEGHERSVTITPLDTGRKYRFLLYGLLGKRRHGPLTADGTTGEGIPCRARLCPQRPPGESVWHPARPGQQAITFGGCHHSCYLAPATPARIQPQILLAQAHSASPVGLSHGKALSLDLSVQPFEVTQPSRNSSAISSLCLHLRDPEYYGQCWHKASPKTSSGG